MELAGLIKVLGGPDVAQVSISSTLYVRIFRTIVVFSSYILCCQKNLYEKFARLMLMKLTAGRPDLDRHT